MKAAVALWSAVIAIWLTQRHAHAYAYGLLMLPTSSFVKSGQHRVLSDSVDATARHRPLKMAAAGGESKKSFFAHVESGWKEKIEARRVDAPDRARFGPSPFGISSKPNSVQASAVAAIVLFYYAWAKILANMDSTFPVLSSWRTAWLPVPLGMFYVFVGVHHFLLTKDMCNIVPDRGAWGFWRLPGRPSFHVKWTGILEVLAGGAMVAGWFGVGRSWMLMEKAAAVMFGVTVAVTPADIFQFTHGAQFPKGIDFPLACYVARGVMQSWFFAVLWKLALL